MCEHPASDRGTQHRPSDARTPGRSCASSRRLHSSSSSSKAASALSKLWKVFSAVLRTWLGLGLGLGLGFGFGFGFGFGLGLGLRLGVGFGLGVHLAMEAERQSFSRRRSSTWHAPAA